MAAPNDASVKRLRITYRKSAIGYNQEQKRTIAALGLRKLGQTVEQPDTPVTRGMIARVNHLVTVEEANHEAT